MIETLDLIAPNQHPTLIEIIDILGYEKISELHFENSEKPSVHFIYNENKFTIELVNSGSYGETISIEVENDNTSESLGYINLSMFNFEKQIDLIVKTILNYD
jgi:hypothetical protein